MLTWQVLYWSCANETCCPSSTVLACRYSEINRVSTSLKLQKDVHSKDQCYTPYAALVLQGSLKGSIKSYMYQQLSGNSHWNLICNGLFMGLLSDSKRAVSEVGTESKQCFLCTTDGNGKRCVAQSNKLATCVSIISIVPKAWFEPLTSNSSSNITGKSM